MADEERQDAEQQPQGNDPAEEGTQGEAPAEERPAAEDEAPAAGGTPAEAQPPADDPTAEEALTEDPPAGDAPSEEQPAAAAPEAKDDKAGAKGEKKDVVPGAELDPIAIESEKPMDAEERARREAEEEERARREAAVLADDEDQPLAQPAAKLSGDARHIATGKRKSSVARVMLTPGSGSIQVNKRSLEEYFPRLYLQTVARQPLVQSGYEGNVDVRINVHGGGISGQAAAVRHGIARALCEVDPALRPELKRRGMLTRDARVKERRKAGLKKARKRPQFSKR